MVSGLFVIDSSPAVRRLVEQASSAEGYEVRVFDNGPAALDAAKRLRPELVIADFHLEGIKFVDFCEELAGLDHASDISIITLVNLGDRPDEEHLRSLGVKAILKKPFHPDHLSQALKKIRSDAQQADSPQKTSSRKHRSWPPVSQATEREGGGPAPDPDDLDDLEASSASPQESSVRASVRASETKAPEVPVKAAAREKLEAPAVEEATRGLMSHLAQAMAEQVERRVSQLLPDLVIREVATHLKRIVQSEIATQLATAISLEQITKVLRDAVERELPTIAAQQMSRMERTLQQSLSNTVGQSVERITDRLVRELVDPTVRKHLPDMVQQQVGALDAYVKEAAQEAASQYAPQAAGAIVREMAKETIKQAVDEIIPDMAEAEIKKEIERLTT